MARNLNRPPRRVSVFPADVRKADADFAVDVALLTLDYLVYNALECVLVQCAPSQKGTKRDVQGDVNDHLQLVDCEQPFHMH